MHATIYSLGPIIIYKINVFWTRIAVQTYVHQAYTRKNKGKRNIIRIEESKPNIR